MKSNLIIFTGCVFFSAAFSSCDGSRNNTKREMDETYTEDGEKQDPTEGLEEGTTGHKFMETTEDDTVDNVEQDGQ